MMRDLVAGQSCGTQNAVSGLISQQMGLADQMQNLSVWDGPKPMEAQHIMPGIAPAADLLQHPGLKPMEAPPAFHPGMMGGPAMAPSMAPMHMHAPHMVGPVMLDPHAMVAEFASHQQQVDFERAFAAPAPISMAPPHHMAAGAMWAQDFHEQMHMHPAHRQELAPAAPWASEYLETPAPVSVGAEADLETAYAEAKGDAELESAYQDATDPAGWASEYAAEQATAADAGAGSAVGMGINKQMIDELLQSDNPKWRNSKFLKFVSRVTRGELEFQGNQLVERVPEAIGGDWASEFGADPTAAIRGTGSYGLEDSLHRSEWAEEFGEGQEDGGMWGDQFAAEGDEVEDAEHMGQGWAAELADQVDADHLAESEHPEEKSDRWAAEYEGQDYSEIDWVKALEKAKTQTAPADPEYKFGIDNPFLSHAEPFQEGLKLLQGGELKQAIQAFEAEVQKNPQNAEAWRYLGQAQAEHEDEANAIAALLKCVSLDPYNLPALLMLGVSYTNDLEEARALNYLKTWLQHNPDYQGVVAQSQVEEYEQFYAGGGGSHADHKLHDEVTKMFHEAVTVNPADSDLYTVLGVLYHISSDYDKAIDSFRRAVKLKPDDAQLWNKLGATQANSSRSADAVHAYRRALELKPNYLRALANLAISFANQGMHADATRTYLATLKQNPNAMHIWSYLRISLSHLGKDDLVELTYQKNPELFRPHFEF